MKKFGIILFAFLAATAASCFDPHDNDHPVYAALATLRAPDASGDSFHFVLDNGQTLYPGDRSRIDAYDPAGCDGHRTVISFNLLPAPIPGYDLHAVLYRIDAVLTGKIGLVTTEEEAAACGDAPLELINAWVSGGWLNLLCSLPQPTDAGLACRLAVVDNRCATPPPDLPADCRCLEVRYIPTGPVYGVERQYASFHLGNYALEGAKGLYLRYRSKTNRIVYLRIDIPEMDNSQNHATPACGLFP